MAKGGNMKKDDNECLILNIDGKIDIIQLKDIFDHNMKNVQYVLLPNPDDDNYYIIENCKFLEMESGTLSYDMYLYTYNEDGVMGTDNAELYLDERKHQTKLNNFYELYCALYDIIKMGYVIELLYDTYSMGEEIEAFCIDNLHIDIKIGDEEFVYDYEMSKKGSIFSRIKKIIKDICTTFNIPRYDFVYEEKVFRIRKNKWDLISQSKIKEEDLVGFIGDLLMTVKFFNYNIFNASIIENPIEVEIYGADIEPLLEDYPLLKTMKTDKNYTSMIDVGTISEPAFTASLILSLNRNQKIEFLSNVRYLCKYVEAFSSMVSLSNAKLDDVICLMLVSFISRAQHFKKSHLSGANRVEYTLTIHHPYIMI